MSSLHSVSSPRGTSPHGVARGSPSSLHGSLVSERGSLELQFQQQQKSNSIASNLKQDSKYTNHELVEIEPDLSWVQSLVGKNEIGKGGCFGDGNALSSTTDEEQAILAAWLEQMQLDQEVVL